MGGVWDMALHPRDSRGEFSESLNHLPKSGFRRAGGQTEIHGIEAPRMPSMVTRTKGGFTVTHHSGSEKEFGSAEEAAAHVYESHERALRDEAARVELEQLHLETQSSREGRAAARQAEISGQLYHRLESDTQTAEHARLQQESGELWGAPRQNYFAGSVPVAQAHFGPLPEGARGLEFTTDIAPDAGGAPHRPDWSLRDRSPEELKHIRQELGPDGRTYAKLKIHVTKNTQV